MKPTIALAPIAVITFAVAGRVTEAVTRSGADERMALEVPLSSGQDG